MSPTISAVVFDLGNVLVHWDPLPAIAHEVGEHEARRFLAEFDFFAWNQRLDEGADIDESVRATGAAHPEWAPHLASYHRHFGDSLVGTVDGSVAVLHELHDTGIPLYALTNWSNGTFHHARERFDWLELFADVVVSGEVGLAKPDPRVFAELARRTGVPLRETFFTDDMESHVRAAEELGVVAVRFRSADQLRGELVRLGLLP